MSTKSPSLYKKMQQIGLHTRKRRRAELNTENLLDDMPLPKMYRANEGQSMYPEPEEVESRDESAYEGKIEHQSENEMALPAAEEEELNLPSESDYHIPLEEAVNAFYYVSIGFTKKSGVVTFFCIEMKN